MPFLLYAPWTTVLLQFVLECLPESFFVVEVEIWEMPIGQFGSFVAAIGAPLGLGTLTLADGSSVHGFLCESWAAAGAHDISAFGGWRRYIATGRPGA